MASKISKVLLVFGLVAIIAVIALYATTNNETYSKSGKVNYKKPQSEKIKGQGEVSSAKVTTRGGMPNRYVTVRRITTSTEKEGYPYWSPDGQWIVFHSEHPSHYGWEIWKINQDGTGLALLARPDTMVYPSMCFNRPSWSPDGAKIAYNSYGDTTHGGWTNADIYIMDPDGSNREMVSHDTTYCHGRGVPEWSPNSKKIVCKHDEYDHLIVIDLDAGVDIDIDALYPGPETIYVSVENQWSKFSPDGSKILFKGYSDYYSSNICVIDTAATNFVCVDTINDVRKGADWSPDGSQIVYSGDRGSSSYSDIFIVNADGTGGHTILSDGSECLQEVDWQPVSPVAFGRWIVYAPTVGSDDDNKNVWVVTTDGLYAGCLCADTTCEYYHVTPQWSPQGDKIVFASDLYSGGEDYDIFVIDLDTDDNDFDSLMNWEEFAGYGTMPNDRDTDKGDENDGSEVFNDRDPFNPADDVGAAPPYTDGHDPAPGTSGADPNTNIVVHVKDIGAGVDIATIVMTVEGNTVTPVITGECHDYTLTYDPPAPFDSGQVVDVTIDASDRALSPNVMPTDAYYFTVALPGIEEVDEGVPTEFNLFQNTPNPTNKTTNIRFAIPQLTHFKLQIYDASGRLVRTLIEDYQSPGYYSVNWDLKDNAGEKVAKGVYYYKFESKDYTNTKKIVVE